MNKQIVSFVQPNFKQGPKEYNAYYLPYSAGVLWSYARTFPVINNNYDLGEFIFRRENIDVVIKKLASSDVVAFSTYVWNHQYNYLLAEQLKLAYPNKLIIFGGPEPAIEDPEFFKKYPFIDIVAKLEGEITFKQMLEKHVDGSFADISGLIYNNQGQLVDTGPAKRIDNLEDVPSPYLTGIFDQLIADNPDVTWNATLETNRGCPYACTFCDWGSLTYNKVKKFNLDRVYDELDWFAKLGCSFISFTDANFGMFVERDDLIADKLIEVQQKYGYPKIISIAWAKNQKQEVVSIVKKLMPYFNHGLTLSVQSLDDGVLENIRRKNMEVSKLEEIFKLCEQNSIPMYTELILGLPGETIASWKENFWRLFRSGNHTGITVYQAQLLENAEMNTLQRSLYKIKSQKVYDYFSGSYSSEEVEESIDVVTSTRDLPLDVMLDAEIFSWFINTFHINGLSTFYSRFANRYLGVEYKDFYNELFDFLQSDSWFVNEQQAIRRNFEEWFEKGKINHPMLGGIEIHGWNLLHRTILNIQIDSKHDHVYNLLNKFMEKYNINPGVMQALNEFQRNFVIVYDSVSTYPKTLTLDYNIYDYITGTSELKEEQTDYYMDFPEDKDISFGRFLEYYYFARRRDFGKAKIKVNKNET
jgi:radical SAM superfamily enzyme YgiQ (UPF0313 family)